jgi:hypothetical protein
MAKQIINVGTTANDRRGDSLRAAFQKVNANFTELYTTLGLDVAPLNLGAFEFTGSTLSTTDSSSITIDQATTVTSNLTVGGDLLPSVANGGDLGSAARPWKSLYVSNSTIYLGSTPLSIDEGGNILIDGNVYGGSSANLGNLKIESSTLGTQGADSNSWGNHNLYLDPGGESNAYISIPSVPNQESGNALQIYNKGDATSIVQVFGRGGVQVVTNTGEGEHVFEFRDDGKLQLPPSGDIVDSTGTSVIGGVSPVQPYLEVTNIPFITQPAVLGTPVTVTAAPQGVGAQVVVTITEGSVLDSITIFEPGTGYVAGQRYKVFFYQIGGPDDASSITLTIDTVDGNGGILTIANAAFVGTPANATSVYVTGLNYQASVFDEIDTGLTLTRDVDQGLYNVETETEYDNNAYLSPLGTEWNADGWGDLTELANRSYTTWRQALNNQVGNYIVASELVMHDTINDKYYKFDFTNWGGGNGSFAYTRTLVEDPNYFKKDDYATANDVDVIEDDSTLQIGITRGNNQGIYNPFTEEGWDEDVSPAGTQWNIDGWDDLSGVETRTYTNFYDAYGNGQLGNRVPGSKAVMYVPDIDKYYAIQWLNWTDGNLGGGFSYTRKEIDLTQLNEGVKFSDGTILKSAEGIGRVKSTAVGNRRIEEVTGYNQVAVTARTTNSLTTIASRAASNSQQIWVDITATTIDEVIDNPQNYGNAYGFQFSTDNVNWYNYDFGYSGDGDERGFDIWPGQVTYDQGDTIYFRYFTGGGSVVWWDKADLPGGAGNFRGAVIDYHAYTGESTIIGTIHIVDDDGEEHISHQEVQSGSTDGENDDLWLVTTEGQIKYRRIDGESKTLKIHWTAKVFYGSELYD